MICQHFSLNCKKIGGDELILDNIKALCEQNNMTISRLEKECGFGNATIRMWENSDPGAKKLKVVADYFNVTVDQLLK